MTLPVTGPFNDGYIADLYARFQRDPASVDETWRQYFRFAEQLSGTTAAAPPADANFLRKVAGAAGLVSAIQRYGHMCVQIDPLGSTPSGAAEVTLEFHGITEDELRQIPGEVLGGSGTAADMVARMRQLWCGTIGFEYDHLENDAEREWFRQTIESAGVVDFSIGDVSRDAGSTVVTVRRDGDLQIPVTVAFTFAGGRVERRTWDGQARYTRFRLDTAERLARVDVDPERHVALDVSWLNNGRLTEPDRRPAAAMSARWLLVVQQGLGWLAF